jgi:hypothetical protein
LIRFVSDKKVKQYVDIDSLISALPISSACVVTNIVELSLDCLLLLGAEQEYGKYKHIVELSKAIFGLRVNYVQWEPELQKSWDDNQVLEGYLKGTLGESKFFKCITFNI